MTGMKGLHIGTMGWSYSFWMGNFYPVGLDPKGFLKEYANHFDSVEIDSSFYRVPGEKVVENWRQETPEGFIFSAKFPGAITHEKMLVDCEEEVQFFIKRISLLGEKLGPLLLQFPYAFKKERYDDLKDFLSRLPKRHRYAVEVKEKKWLSDRFYRLLGDTGVALALVDHPWMPETNELTADFTYIRWEGDRKKIKGTTGAVERDRKDDISAWALRIEKFLRDSIEVYGYFSKYYSGHSPTDSKYMLSILDKDL